MSKRLFKTMVAVLAIAAAAAGPVRGQNSSTSTLNFTAAYGAGPATADDEVEWTVSSDGNESNYDGTKGIHYGTNSAQVGYIQLSTSDIIGTITQVKVNASTASGVNEATVGVTVGGNAFGGSAQSLSTNATDYTFTGSATGEIVVRVAKPEAANRALYVKSVVVTYTPASAGSSTPEPMQTTYNVTFGGFNQPAMNTTVSVASLPQTFTGVGGLNFYPFAVLSNGGDFSSASVTSGGNGKVSVDVAWNQMAITVTGTFEGTATIHVVGHDNNENPASCDITVACTLPPVPITVRLAAGTEDAANWSIASGNALVQGNQVLENVMSGSQVTATYSGTTKKVKGVKAVKYVAPAATVTTAPTATAGIIEAGSTTALVSAGTASGGTMMYAVTTTNVQPASTDGFSATLPTAQGRAAGTYYVWFYAKADAEHSDSEIAGPVSVTLPVMTTVTWNSSNVFNSDHENDVIRSWQSGSLTYEDITISKPGTGNAAFYAYDFAGQTGSLSCYGSQGDSYTFTAPSGKKFCKIEIIDNEGVSFTNYGDWTKDVIHKKIVWSGTAATAVTLGGTNNTFAYNLNSIVFTLIDAQ